MDQNGLFTAEFGVDQVLVAELCDALFDGKLDDDDELLWELLDNDLGAMDLDEMCEALRPLLERRPNGVDGETLRLLEECRRSPAGRGQRLVEMMDGWDDLLCSEVNLIGHLKLVHDVNVDWFKFRGGHQDLAIRAEAHRLHREAHR